MADNFTLLADTISRFLFLGVSLNMKYRFDLLVISFIVYYIIWTFGSDITDGNGISFFEQSDQLPNAWVITVTSCIYQFLYIFMTYTLLWYFSGKKQFLTAFVLIVLLCPAVMMVRYIMEEVIAPAVWGIDNYYDSMSMKHYLVDNKFYAIINCAFGTAYFFIQHGRYKEVLEAEIRLQHQQSELDFLKSQINPHFLFNSLNNIYSLIYHRSEHALTAVDKLSGLLRYMLYEKSTKVPLRKEIDYIQNFIDLQKMRYNFEFPLDLILNIEDPEVEIAPLILIPFLENAFKHGQYSPGGVPLKVHLSASKTALLFNVCNAKNNSQKDNSSGIGLENVRRRLDLLYPGSYEWTTDETAESYCITLKINYE